MVGLWLVRKMSDSSNDSDMDSDNDSNSDSDNFDQTHDDGIGKKRRRVQYLEGCPEDFPISRDPSAPTKYTHMQEIVDLMARFGKKTNVNYTCDAGKGGYWCFSCNGCRRAHTRACAYVPIIKMNKRYKLGLEQPDEPPYSKEEHGIVFAITKNTESDQQGVYLLTYNADHRPSCTRTTCTDEIPDEEVAINNFAKKVGRAMCALIDSHVAREDKTLTLSDLVQIEQLRYVFDRMLPEYAFDLENSVRK